MKSDLAQVLQRDHYFAIVDEVNSILIDEARTPLIISGPSQDRSELYIKIDKLIPKLTAEHYDLDEKQRSTTLTEDGNEFVERRLREMELLAEDATLYDPESTNIVHHVNQALRAHVLFHRDKDYIVRNGEVVLIDEFTGRMMSGRRLSEGLHQAIEAKEGVGIRPENVTLASRHLPELLPPLREARRHDRHRRDRGRRVLRDLQARRGRGPDQHAGDPRGPRRPGVPHRPREVRGDRRGDPARPRGRPADPRRHHLDREVRDALGAAEEGARSRTTC